MLLPPLRLNLDFLPSPDATRPGLVIRDPYKYSPSVLLIPPPLVRGLQLFDGSRSLSDLQSELAPLTGSAHSSAVANDLLGALDQAGFLENENYEQMKAHCEAEFAAEPVRKAAFAGSAYPADAGSLSGLLNTQIGNAGGHSQATGIAAPHASPEGGWATYRAAYSSMPAAAEAQDRTFIILGTSHYGAPEYFGLTRKPFVTPLGEARTDLRLINELQSTAPNAVHMEDYCHSMEHSIELQIIFLQHIYGPNVNIVPILCGPFARSLYYGGVPEKEERVSRFFDALGNLSAREGAKLFWILGIDMAHIGTRYGDARPVVADQEQMLDVKRRDLTRIEQITEGNRHSYWDLVQENHDDLRWCGSAPLYTFLKVMPQARGHLLNYQQWQIDHGSVVSFAAMQFE